MEVDRTAHARSRRRATLRPIGKRRRHPAPQRAQYFAHPGGHLGDLAQIGALLVQLSRDGLRKGFFGRPAGKQEGDLLPRVHKGVSQQVEALRLKRFFGSELRSAPAENGNEFTAFRRKTFGDMEVNDV